MDRNDDIYEEYVQLLDRAIKGSKREVQLLAKRCYKKFSNRPNLQEQIRKILSWIDQNNTSITRGADINSLPIDTDTRLELMKSESVALDFEPVWPNSVSSILQSIIDERSHEEELFSLGLHPTKSILFVGPPGVGKTLAARWISQVLNKKLLTLDLAAVMSSFLGRTGNNIRAVLNYAMQTSSILLLDEFDSIAKKRDDDSEIGELKRLVTVLLQAIDDWPDNGILIAATNHPDLLDPAVWRRFERIIEFPFPEESEIEKVIKCVISAEEQVSGVSLSLLSASLYGSSFAEVVRTINELRRESIIKKLSLDFLIEKVIVERVSKLTKEGKRYFAKKLIDSGITQRKTSEITGISRDTIRKYVKM